jgi:DTW domain-containing protein YfiP
MPRIFPDVLEAPKADRERLMVKRRLEVLANIVTKQKLCSACSLMQETCICSKLKDMKPDNPTGFRLAVHMHVKERFRSSNSGKLLEQMYEAPVFIDSDPDQMKKMAELVEENVDNCVVMFPTEEAKAFSDLKLKDNPIIFLIDGTWRQARRLNKNIPDKIPRVKIHPQTISRFLCRTQTQPDRVCTAEATAMLLEDLGHPAESERVLQALEILQQAFNMQTFHKTERPPDRLKKQQRLNPT